MKEKKKVNKMVNVKGWRLKKQKEKMLVECTG